MSDIINPNTPTDEIVAHLHDIADRTFPHGTPCLSRIAADRLQRVEKERAALAEAAESKKAANPKQTEPPKTRCAFDLHDLITSPNGTMGMCRLCEKMAHWRNGVWEWAEAPCGSPFVASECLGIGNRSMYVANEPGSGIGTAGRDTHELALHDARALNAAFWLGFMHGSDSTAPTGVVKELVSSARFVCSGATSHEYMMRLSRAIDAAEIATASAGGRDVGESKNAADQSGISQYWKGLGKTLADRRPGRTFESSYGPRCAECCNGDRCDDPSHYDRESCPFCLGTGATA